MKIEFNYSNENYKLLDEHRIRDWIFKVIKDENKVTGEIEYNFVSEEEILDINKEFLDHDYFTDIITFDNCFVNIINGTIFISLDTIKYNSQRLKKEYLSEVYRVIVHGIMHLCGYKDKTDVEKEGMRYVEDKYLSYLDKI